MTEISRLFVYGTLGPNKPNEHVLNGMEGSWDKACVRGIWYDEGWGAAMGYPGIRLDKDGDIVRGHVFSSEQLKANWKELDAFEGEGYRRVLTKVTLSDATLVDAFIYTLR